MKSLSLLVPLLAAAYASAHGFVASIAIDGKNYDGDSPRDPPSDVQSVIRQISTISPVKGANNPDVNCGPSAVASSLVANANPGSTIDFLWTDGDAKWPHNTGPMLTYMASCGSSTCDKFDSTQAQWFKIDQVGKNNDDRWAQADLMDGKPATITLPATLAPGNYMIRHEIIALHLGVSMGGAEFYPSCAQLTVGGSQTGGPQPNELVKLPGAYKDSDPGIFDPNVFSPGSSYTFPGPPVAAFVGTGSSGSGSGSNSSTTAGSSTASGSPTVSGSTPSSTSSAYGQQSSGTCKLRRSASPYPAVDASVIVASVRPRHISRVMGRLISGKTH